MKHFIEVLVLIFLPYSFSLGQVKKDTTSAKPDTSTAVLSDSLKVTPFVPLITSPNDIKAEKKGFQQTKSATLAIVYSAILPGVGQAYDESYWKIPIIWGLGGYWIYEYASNNSDYKNYRDLYLQSLELNGGFGDGRLQKLRDFYRDERDKFGWYLGVLYLANVIDAYIGAHLYDFDVSPDLGEHGPSGMRVNARIRF